LINKQVSDAASAIADVPHGATMMVSGFGEPGVPKALLTALLEHGASDLTLIANTAGTGFTGIAALLQENRVRKIICSYPRCPGSVVFEELYARGAIEVELVPIGTLCERIRAGAAGLGGFYTPTTVGTRLAQGKEHRDINGKTYVLEMPLKADFSLIKANKADRWGNLVYSAAGRSFGPVMAGAATVTIAEVDDIVPLGELHPEHIVTPGILVNRVTLG